MTIEQFRATIGQQPFRAFTIHTVDGRIFLLLMSELEVPSTQSKAG